MNIVEAYHAMKQGKMVTRKGIITGYIVILPGQYFPWNILTATRTPNINAIIYSPSNEDLGANDWEIV